MHAQQVLSFSALPAYSDPVRGSRSAGPRQIKLPAQATRRPYKSSQASALCSRRGNVFLRQISQRVSTANARKSRSIVTQASAVEDVVNTGLELFDNGNYKEALAKFDAAAGMGPTDEEKRAVYYNRACAYVKLGQFEPACSDLKLAVNECELQLSTLLKDPDLEVLRESAVFDDLYKELKGGGLTINDESNIKIRTELKAPFRLARLFTFGSFLTGSSLGLLVTVTQLIGGIGGAPGAPDLFQSVRNFVINLVCVVAFGAIVRWDLQNRKKEEDQMRKAEEMGSLLVKRGKTTVPLSRLRLSNRPIIIAGNKKHVQEQMRLAKDKYKSDLIDRGVLMIGVVWGADDVKASMTSSEDDKFDPFLQEKLRKKRMKDLKKELNPNAGAMEASPSPSTTAPVQTLPPATSEGGQLQLEAVGQEKWQQFVIEQLEGKTEDTKQPVYISLALDGTVRNSGAGAPPWELLLTQMSPLDSTMTKIFQT